MAHDFFDPTPEQQNVVLVNAATLHEAERLIESCEGGKLMTPRSPSSSMLATRNPLTPHSMIFSCAALRPSFFCGQLQVVVRRSFYRN